MRWFFLFVLALNLSYISWHLLSEPAPYADVPPLKKDIEPIVLLSERDSADSKQAPSSAGDAVQDQAGQVVQDGQKPADVADGPSAEKASTGKGAESGSDTAVALAAAKQDKPAVLKVRSESARREPPGKTEKVIKPEAGTALMEQGVASKGEENCYTLGPFRDLDALRSLTRDIKSYVVSADFRGEEVTEQSSYWVFIRPVKTQDQAGKLAARLKANKITDFYIIRKGEQKNGISLGRFRNKASAYGLAKQVSKLDFDVAVEPVYRNVTHYWLDYQLSEDANIPRTVFDKYIDGKSGEFSRKSRVCS